MKALLIPITATALGLAGCSPSDKEQTGDSLRSDIPPRSVEFLLDHPTEAAKVRAMCDQWKGSQRPIASWPTVVTQNCNNDDTVRMIKIQDEQRNKMKRQMGI